MGGRQVGCGVTLRIGSLCTGYGGLDRAVHEVLGGELAWVADNDPGAAAILAHRFPSVPNLGDLTTVDWADVEPVDVVIGGFPCQDISYAGRGAGIQEGNRSGLWYTIADALGILRPSLVVLENVAALVGRRPGLDVVLGDLARLGFDAEWTCLRAADVGAPHARKRIFLTAWPAENTHGATGGQRRITAPGQAAPGRARADTGGSGGAPAPADADHGHGTECAPRRHEPGRRPAGSGEVSPDPGRYGLEGQRADAGQAARRAAEATGGRGSARGDIAATNATGDGRDEGWPEPAGIVRGPDAAERGDGPAADSEQHQLSRESPEGWRSERGTAPAGTGPGAWGPYGPAIRRWESILGRPAPRPTEPGRTGERLSPRFVEFLMGLPDGWVTDVPGLSRNAQLKALGNGVVPQQAVAALRLLLPVQAEAAA